MFEPGTIIVFSNKRWKPLRGTPWEGLEKVREFQKHLGPLKAGKTQYYHGNSFMMVGELVK